MRATLQGIMLPYLQEYESLGVIGEGTYGTVVKARHRRTGCVVAIKQFKEPDDEEQVGSRRQGRRSFVPTYTHNLHSSPAPCRNCSANRISTLNAPMVWLCTGARLL